MSKQESILKDLKNVLRQAILMGCNNVKAFRDIPLENVEVIIEVLEKQCAKKVVEIKATRDFAGCIVTFYAKCPECGCLVRSDKTDYCNCCGQKLDWKSSITELLKKVKFSIQKEKYKNEWRENYV